MEVQAQRLECRDNAAFSIQIGSGARFCAFVLKFINKHTDNFTTIDLFEKYVISIIMLLRCQNIAVLQGALSLLLILLGGVHDLLSLITNPRVAAPLSECLQLLNSPRLQNRVVGVDLQSSIYQVID